MGEINLAWTDNSNNETGFKIDRATNSGFTQNLVTHDGRRQHHKLLGHRATPGTTYYYRVRATNSRRRLGQYQYRQRNDRHDVIQDNSDSSGVTITGSWTAGTGVAGYYGTNYLYDNGLGQGTSNVLYSPTFAAGVYQVYINYTSYSNRADQRARDRHPSRDRDDGDRQ